MAASSLPLELVDLFMEELFDDKRSLSQSSLVCRQWTIASSRNLFRKLRLNPQVEDETAQDWYETFLLQIKTLPRLCTNVHQLTFTSERADGQPVCSGPVLQHILAALPNLRIFEMSYLDFDGSQNRSDFALNLPPVTSLLKLERVELRNVLGLSTYCGRVVESGSSDSFGLAEFLNMFDEIRDIQLDNGALPFMYPVTWHLLEASPKPLGRPQGRLLQVERVHLTGQQSARSLAVLQHMVDLRELKRLRIQLSPAVLRLVDEFISRSINIEHIHLSLRLDLMSSQCASVTRTQLVLYLTMAFSTFARPLLATQDFAHFHDRLPPGHDALGQRPMGPRDGSPALFTHVARPGCPGHRLPHEPPRKRAGRIRRRRYKRRGRSRLGRV